MSDCDLHLHKTIEILSDKPDTLEGLVLDHRYEVQEKIGEGGQGDVYRGRQLRLNRPVAIKIPRPELLRNSGFRQRFEAEAATAARCVHENIVTIYDVHVAPSPGELSYIVMQLVSGSQLSDFLYAEQANLTVQDVLNILRQLARGVDAAHAAGILHGDIKPQNVIVTMPKRVVKIMDFGMAKSLDHCQRSESLKGTPAYMAPEQVENDELGTFTDIYALAAVIFRVFARDGHRDGRTLKEMLLAVRNQPPVPLRQRNPNWPAAVEKVLLRALDRDPGARPETAFQLVDELSEALSGVANRSFAEFFQKPAARASMRPTLKQLFWNLADRLPDRSALVDFFEKLAAPALNRFERRTVVLGAVGAAMLLLTGLIAMIGSGEAPEHETSAVLQTGSDGSRPGAARLEVPGTGGGNEKLPPAPDDAPSQPAPDSTAVVAKVDEAPVEEVVEPGPAERGPLLLGSEKRAEAKTIASDVVYEKIRLPIFRGRFEAARATFLNVADRASVDEFFELIEELARTHKRLKLKFEGNETIYRYWAEISYRFEIVGKPRHKRGYFVKDETVVSEFTALVHFAKKEKRWTLIDWPTQRFVEHTIRERGLAENDPAE